MRYAIELFVVLITIARSAWPEAASWGSLAEEARDSHARTHPFPKERLAAADAGFPSNEVPSFLAPCVRRASLPLHPPFSSQDRALLDVNSAQLGPPHPPSPSEEWSPKPSSSASAAASAWRARVSLPRGPTQGGCASPPWAPPAARAAAAAEASSRRGTSSQPRTEQALSPAPGPGPQDMWATHWPFLPGAAAAPQAPQAQHSRAQWGLLVWQCAA